MSRIEMEVSGLLKYEDSINLYLHFVKTLAQILSM